MMSLCRRRWAIIFGHPIALWTLALVTLHQGIVASSTFFLTAIITLFQAGQPFLPSLWLYLTTMSVPYLPGTLAFACLQVWVNRTHARFVAAICDAGADRVGIYRDGALRERTESLLSRNAYPIVKDYLGAVHELASFALNSVLSVAVIGLLLPSRLLLGYVISLVLCALIIAGLTPLIGRRSAGCEDSYVQFSGTLHKCWDNLVLANRHNRSAWTDCLRHDAHHFYRASNRLELLKQAGNLLLAAASLLPSILLIASIAAGPPADAAMLAAVIVSLTRIFLILNSLSTLVYRVLDLISLHARMQVLLRLETALRCTDATVPGRFRGIAINGHPVEDLHGAMALLAAHSSGRFTITGPNGSGKSTLLLALKAHYGEHALLLPAQAANLVWTTPCEALSTGQKSATMLHEILSVPDIDALLLDEWDANMDQANTARIDALLSRIGTEKIVIETRH